MNRLIDDGHKIIALCRSMAHDEVIKCIINDDEISNYIHKICKDAADATSVMHDTVLSLIRSCMKEGFAFSSKPIAYIKTIAKYTNIKLSKNSSVRTYSIADVDLAAEVYDINYELKEILQDLLSSISNDCKEILLMWSLKYKMKEIAKKLNYNSESYIKKKKHLCLKKLIKVVESDPKLKEELKLYV